MLKLIFNTQVPTDILGWNHLGYCQEPLIQTGLNGSRWSVNRLKDVVPFLTLSSLKFHQTQFKSRMLH